MAANHDLKTNLSPHFSDRSVSPWPTAEESVGLSVDMLDIDRLKQWADNVYTYGSDLTQWASPQFISEWLRDFAARLETVVRDVGTLRAAAQMAQTIPQWQEMLKRLVIAWDTDDNLDFLAAVTHARHALGLKLADENEAREDAEVLVVNGYTAEGVPDPPHAPETKTP